MQNEGEPRQGEDEAIKSRYVLGHDLFYQDIIEPGSCSQVSRKRWNAVYINIYSSVPNRITEPLAVSCPRIVEFT